MIDTQGHDTTRNEAAVSPDQSDESHAVSEEATLDLRAIRQARGLTLQDLSASTRISPQNLKAIEEKRFDLLPEPIYARAFIDMYARALDMNGQQIRSLYEAYLSTLERGEDSYELLNRLGLKKRRREIWLWLIIGAILLAVVGTFSLYQWGIGDRQEPEILSPAVHEQPSDELPVRREEVPVPETDSVIPEDTGEPQEGAHTIPSTIPGTEQAQEENQARAEDTQPVVQAEQHETGNTRPGIEPQQSENTATTDTSVPTEEKPYTLVIEASELTWLQIEKDEEPPFEIMLRQGEKTSQKASERFILHIGNAGGVDIQFQGKSLGALGGHGQVIHLTLPPGE